MALNEVELNYIPIGSTYTPNDSTVSIVLPSVSLSGETSLTGSNLSGNLRIPSQIIRGEITKGNVLNIKLPTLIISGDISSENIIKGGELIVPSISVSGRIEGPQKIILPSLILTGEILSGQLVKGSLSLKNVKVKGKIIPTFKGKVSIPAPLLDGTILHGGLSSLNISTVLPKIKGRILSSSKNNVLIELPSPIIKGVILQSGLLSGQLVLPNVIVNGFIHSQQQETYDVYSICTDNISITEYKNFNFHSFVKFQGKVFGVKSDGIYLLEGDDDDGDLIESKVVTAAIDVGETNKKRITDLYLAGDLIDKDSLDGLILVKGEENQRPSINSKLGDETIRVKLPRGLKFRKAQLGFVNKNGDDFNIESLEAKANFLSRKVK